MANSSSTGSKRGQSRAKTPKLKRQPGKPLYAQVEEIIRKRLIDNYWKPGDVLPSEFDLARELSVSQGTVRKALNEMVAENLLERRQGLGTFVSEYTERRALFLYFNLIHPLKMFYTGLNLHGFRGFRPKSSYPFTN